MRILLTAVVLIVAAANGVAADLKVELKRLSGGALPSGNVDVVIERFDSNGTLLETIESVAAVSADVASIALPGTAAEPIRVTVVMGGYDSVSFEPLNPTKIHDVKLILGRTVSEARASSVSESVTRRVVGGRGLRFHLAGEASTVHDENANRLEVLSPITSNDPNHDVYRSDQGGKWAVGKHIRVKCVYVHGRAIWKTLGIPVWRTDPAQRRWIFKGYLQLRHTSTVVVQKETVQTVQKRTFD